jgi:hypothetical protein
MPSTADNDCRRGVWSRYYAEEASKEERQSTKNMVASETYEAEYYPMALRFFRLYIYGSTAFDCLT